MNNAARMCKKKVRLNEVSNELVWSFLLAEVGESEYMYKCFLCECELVYVYLLIVMMNIWLCALQHQGISVCGGGASVCGDVYSLISHLLKLFLTKTNEKLIWYAHTHTYIYIYTHI